MTLVKVAALVIAVPLFVLGVIRFVRSFAVSIPAYRNGNGVQQEAQLATQRATVPLGIAIILGYLAIVPFIGWEAFLVIAILAAYYAAGMTWWHHLWRNEPGDWRWKLVGTYLSGLWLGIFMWSSFHAHGPLYSGMVLLAWTVLRIIIARTKISIDA